MKPSRTYIDHTADILFKAEAPTLEELFVQCALALEESQVEINLIEKEIPQIEDEIFKLNLKIEKEASNLSPTQFKVITNDLEKLQQKLDELESRWLELDEKE